MYVFIENLNIIPKFSSNASEYVALEFINTSQRDKNHSKKKTTTLLCLSIGTSKTINFPFVPNEKFKVFRLNTLNFPFGTNGKLTIGL